MGAPLHLFRAGTYTDMHGREITISAPELAASAAAYDPALHQAPIVVGHPKHNAPAFGWLASLTASGDDLEGDPVEVDPQFAEAVRAGRYKTRSASFWPPSHPDNPAPGVWYLRHLGFLGGVAPAVKGLRGADLAEDDAQTITIDFSGERPTDPEAQMPESTPSTQEQAPAVDLAAREAELSARVADLESQAAALAVREQALADQEAASRRAEVAAFAEALANQARLRPGDVPRVTEIILALAEARPEPAAEFAAAEDCAQPMAAAEWLRGYLAAQPPLVELSEVATKERAESKQPAEFSAPAGFAADPEALALHRKAKQYQAEHPDTDYKAAVAAVSARI